MHAALVDDDDMNPILGIVSTTRTAELDSPFGYWK